MLFNTSLAIALALQIKTEIKNVIPKVDDVYYISEEGSINENVPTDECFATVVKQGVRVIYQVKLTWRKNIIYTKVTTQLLFLMMLVKL